MPIADIWVHETVTVRGSALFIVQRVPWTSGIQPDMLLSPTATSWNRLLLTIGVCITCWVLGIVETGQNVAPTKLICSLDSSIRLHFTHYGASACRTK